jgi:hypothetical protein
MILSEGEACAAGALTLAMAATAARLVGLSIDLPSICWRADGRAPPRRPPRRAPLGLEEIICNFQQLVWRRDKKKPKMDY